MIVIALLSFILQTLLSQKGILSAGVIMHSSIITLTPLCTFVLEGLILHIWHWYLLGLSLLCPFFFTKLPRQLIQLRR